MERWAAAVHRGDMAGVLADHADDIVMFDVPPPEDGVRGIAAYESTWPPFFDFQRSGASFEIVSLEIVAGGDVAYAFALLRCGSVEELRTLPDRRLAAAATSICRRVDSVTVTESVSDLHYESAEAWLAVDMSLPEATPEVLQSARGALTSFRDSVARVAEALESQLDDIAFALEYAKAAETIDLGWFRIEQGTHAALRGGWDGKVGGRTVIRQRIVWYMTRALGQAWEIDENNYLVDVDGEPRIASRVAVKVPPDWSHLEHAIVTALPAVSAVFAVKAAPPGILGLRGSGLVTAPAGVWQWAGNPQ